MMLIAVPDMVTMACTAGSAAITVPGETLSTIASCWIAMVLMRICGNSSCNNRKKRNGSSKPWATA